MHVGMNRQQLQECFSSQRVPHARGDEPGIVFIHFPHSMSSPCTWG